MQPKPSQNPAQNSPKVDVMLRTLKTESEQKVPHFCSFLLFPNLAKSASNVIKNQLKFRPILNTLLEAQKTRFVTFRGRFLGPNLVPTWLHLGSKTGYNEVLCWPCLNHGWPGRVRTQKPTQNEADFGQKLFQIRFQRASNSALTEAPAELLLHNEDDAC